MSSPLTPGIAQRRIKSNSVPVAFQRSRHNIVSGRMEKHTCNLELSHAVRYLSPSVCCVVMVRPNSPCNPYKAERAAALPRPAYSGPFMTNIGGPLRQADSLTQAQ